MASFLQNTQNRLCYCDTAWPERGGTYRVDFR